ncbi:hypothetical protein V8E55_008987 [Tylopilus felleus]
MDTFKVEPYSDTPGNLEKGAAPAEPLHPQPCHGCPVHPTQAPRRRRFKRHLIIFGAVVLTWLAYSFMQRAFSARPRYVWRWAVDRVGHPPPPDGDDDQCVGSTNWTTYYDQPPWTSEYPYGAETTFSLPLDSDALYLVSRGIFQHGLVTIEQSEQVGDTVDVRVRVAYYDDQVLESATVCQVQREDREHGVGIFTPWGPFGAPPRRMHMRGLEFDVTVTLPAGEEGPLSVKQLETRLPSYNQNVANLEESVLFDVISLASVNGRISIQSVTADVAQFRSVNGEIDGQFNTESSLELHTVNGRITPTVRLLHREGADPSDLSIHTINGQINAEVSLTSETSSGGEFGVDAESIHGAVEIKFTDSPVDSVLRCEVGSMVGAVQVEVHSAFEGTYSLQTMLGSKSVLQREVEDPAGRGRHRVVSLDEARGRIEGEIKWEENDGSSVANEGYVILKALMPSVTLLI